MLTFKARQLYFKYCLREILKKNWGDEILQATPCQNIQVNPINWPDIDPYYATVTIIINNVKLGKLFLDTINLLMGFRNRLRFNN